MSRPHDSTTGIVTINSPLQDTPGGIPRLELYGGTLYAAATDTIVALHQPWALFSITPETSPCTTRPDTLNGVSLRWIDGRIKNGAAAGVSADQNESQFRIRAATPTYRTAIPNPIGLMRFEYAFNYALSDGIGK